MTFSTQRHIDRLCGPLIICGTLPLRLLNRLLHSFGREKLGSEIKTITVSKYLGMGSILLASPLLKRLKQVYPDACITFLSFEDNKSILEHIENVDRVELLSSKNVFQIFLSVVRYLLRSPKPDIFIDLEFFSYFSLIIQMLSFPRYCVGFWERTFFFRSLFVTHRICYNPHKHVAEMFYHAIYALRPDLTFNDPALDLNLPRLHYSKESLTSLTRKLQPYDSDHYQMVTINPHASDLSHLRRWPIGNFQRLMDRLLAYPNVVVVTIGGPKDVEYNHRVVHPFLGKNRFVDLCGKLSLDELIALVSNINLFITNDSGPMHIANAQGTQVFALFGPESPVLYGPIGFHSRCRVFYKSAYCSPCLDTLNDKVTNCQLNRCLMEIGVSEVMGAFDHFSKSNQIIKKYSTAA